MSYLVLGLLWALGGPGYPFDEGRARAGNTLLDPVPAAVGGGVLALSALVTAGVAALAARGPLNRTPAVVAVVAGVGLAVVLPDVRIMMTAGYLPVMLAAVLAGQAEFSMIASMLTWPSVNLLILTTVGVSLMVLGMRALLGGHSRPVSAAGALRIGLVMEFGQDRGVGVGGRHDRAHLREGAFVVKTKLTEVRPVAHDRDRERRLWEATTELLERAGASRQ
ncbi:hypothetical protein ABZ912_49375 [Nonomuraea angiospora]|uniref:hypothetical protein n=1 Tax=Nonomuraea angiospora TaxID=46172 RepID=UPI0033C92FE9